MSTPVISPPNSGRTGDDSEEEKFVSNLESAFGESEDGVRNDTHAKSHRTKGLWLFDNVLFNATNLAVFALSVFATYKTNYSQSLDTPKELQNWWMKRGNEAVEVFKKTGMNEEKARNANMVLWSFIDGTVAAPFVAMLEHRRKEIGQWIDDKLGTKPKDASAYHNQPKVGWKSVFLGRLAAFSIVTPTYFVLSAKNKKDPASLSLNNILFDKTADAIVEHNVAGIPGALEKHFPKLHVKGLVNTAVFEAFYTTLCTTILFAVSYLSGRHDHHEQLHAAAKQNASAATALQGEGEQEAANARSSWHERVRPAGKDGVSHTRLVALSRAGPTTADQGLATP